jgi:hypothetical protein
VRFSCATAAAIKIHNGLLNRVVVLLMLCILKLQLFLRLSEIPQNTSTKEFFVLGHFRYMFSEAYWSFFGVSD